MKTLGAFIEELQGLATMHGSHLPIVAQDEHGFESEPSAFCEMDGASITPRKIVVKD